MGTWSAENAVTNATNQAAMRERQEQSRREDQQRAQAAAAVRSKRSV